MESDIAAYYEKFWPNFLRDYLNGNLRVQRQLHFFLSTLPKRTTKKVLVVGSGSGEGAEFLSRRLGLETQILGVDLSGQNAHIAQSLFPGRNVEYRQANILVDEIANEWDAILLPDVYEHIPATDRAQLHSKLSSLLAVDGSILLTLPSPYHQSALRARGQGLQVVDETVTLPDVQRLASDVGGSVTYFSMISVWRANDYIHAVVERHADRYATLDQAEKTPIKGWRRPRQAARALAFVNRRLSLSFLRRAARRRMLAKRLPSFARELKSSLGS